MSRLHRLLLGAVGALGLLAAGCTVDLDDVSELSDRCSAVQRCAEGRTCEAERCVLAAGAACTEEDPLSRCERTLNVCASAQRRCINGRAEQTCGAENYGPAFEDVEARCDGLDNDCDAFVDAHSVTLALSSKALLAQAQALTQGLGTFYVVPPTTQVQGSLTFQLVGPKGASVGSPVDVWPGLVPNEALQWVSAASSRHVFVLWQLSSVVNGLFVTRYYVARVDLPQQDAGKVAVGVTAKLLQAPTGLTQMPRLAVARDGEHVLVLWPQGFSARASVLGTDLEEQVSRTLEIELGTPPSGAGAPAVGPLGDSGFAVAWMVGTGSGSTSLHAQSFSASLTRLDLRTLALSVLPQGSMFGELRLLARPELTALTALVTATRVVPSSGDSAQTQQLAAFVNPFGEGAALPALDVTTSTGVLLQSGLLADGTALLAHVPVSPRPTNWKLRSVPPTGPVREQPLPADPTGDPPQLVVSAEGTGFASFQRVLQTRYVLAPSTCAP